MSAVNVNPLDHLAIQNVIARYCQALDTKNFGLLHKVFMPDVIADYPFQSDMRGVEAISTAIQNRYMFPRLTRASVCSLINEQPGTCAHSSQPHHAKYHFQHRWSPCQSNDTFRRRALWTRPT